MTTVPFDELMREVMAGAGRFGHRQHVQLTWLAVRCYGTATAFDLVCEGIQQTPRYGGAPHPWKPAGAGPVAPGPGPGDGDFEQFLGQNPALLDKRLLTRFYRPSTLASAQARTTWTEPDLAPFPWLPRT